MPSEEIALLEQHASTAELSRLLLVYLARSSDPRQILGSVLPQLVPTFRCGRAGIVRQRGRGWAASDWIGTQGPLPETLIGEVVDAGRGKVGRRQVEGSWVAAPLDVGDAIPRVLLLGGCDPDRPPRIEEIEAVARLVGMALQIARRQQHSASRCERLAAMLRIGAQWSQTEHSSELLEAIAAAATRLLGAERASIFLWDRSRRKLVGRPALGVEGGQLEVDDSEGIVGAVLQSGRPRRWQAGDDGEAEVNRSVDRRLRFETCSLLAVPLWDPQAKEASGAAPAEWQGEARLGVFELINCRSGAFTEEDVEALEEFAAQAAAAIRSTQTREALAECRDRMTDSAAEGARVIGNHSTMVALRETARRVAETDLAVLVLGENGTGKEVLARSIHFQGPRKHQPFIAVNCAALVESLLESELFGHEKGAFTDAHQTRVGKFELASGGTLFLDEVGDLSPGGQAKLLRVLEEKIVVRVGGSTPIPIDVRVVAATNQPLAEMVRAKRFREDLFFRLNVVTLQLPPLRERGEDILALADHFLHQFAHQVGRRVPRLSEAARRQLLRYSWPGNIRELRNLIERICYLCGGDTVEASDLALSSLAGPLAMQGETPAAAPASNAGRTLADATRDFQVQHIEQAIAACEGNMTDAAGRLGLHRSNLYRKMRQLGISGAESES
ncbi:sigma-54-dependent Fis family transcriptional regulator [Candidatus Laterigemmans baculatus]|uniref:sigma-54-dependent Fis family transcriptional regulator n=1 Tax=Candidatus Laterigemmans baculatus TaxID=2770505 RepID=UPI0013DCEB03|nr:sigma-54-dependent Fis family transcriptional regulator [Candidatus Laterigemmans baculatus]